MQPHWECQVKAGEQPRNAAREVSGVRGAVRKGICGSLQVAAVASPGLGLPQES